jgi:uncharacterized protein YycO
MPVLTWRCVADDSIVGEAIKFVSRGAVTHVEFVIKDGSYTIGARADGGVQARPINYAKFNLDLRFQTQCTDEQYNAAMDFLDEQIGKPYDFIDIAAIAIDRNWRDPAKWICSELWAATMEQAGLIGKMHSSINLFTPQDSLIVSCATFQPIT